MHFAVDDVDYNKALVVDVVVSNLRNFKDITLINTLRKHFCWRENGSEEKEEKTDENDIKTQKNSGSVKI